MLYQKGSLSNTEQGHPCSKGISARTVVPLPGADTIDLIPPIRAS
jgi:hypothetical protein